MSIGWIYHDDFLRHDTGPMHPERPDRLRAIVRAFEESGLGEQLTRIEPQPCEPDRLHRIHTPQHVERMEALCRRAPAVADAGDTIVSAESYSIALRAVGGVLAAADAIMAGQFKRIFSTHRPPGHHAERDRAMGFCLFNHIAIAADYLTHAHHLPRVAVVDFDVHHGNGTQHSFDERADVLFISIHQDPRTLYPGTGFAHETGRGAGEGLTLNVPMAPGSGDDDYRGAFDEKIIPKLDEYRPQLLLISAGFDAMAEDPLANIELTDRAFDWMTRRLVQVAERHCESRVLSVLEGGYDLSALGRAAIAHARALLD